MLNITMVSFFKPALQSMNSRHIKVISSSNPDVDLYKNHLPFPKIINKMLKNLSHEPHPLSDKAKWINERNEYRQVLHEVISRAHRHNVPFIHAEMKAKRLPGPSRLWPTCNHEDDVLLIRAEVWAWAFDFTLAYGESMARDASEHSHGIRQTDYIHIAAAHVALAQHFTESQLQLYGEHIAVKFVNPLLTSSTSRSEIRGPWVARTVPMIVQPLASLVSPPARIETSTSTATSRDVERLTKRLEEVENEKLRFQLSARSWERQYGELVMEREKLDKTVKVLTGENEILRDELSDLRFKESRFKERLEWKDKKLNFYAKILDRGDECPQFRKFKQDCPNGIQCPLWHTMWVEARPEEIKDKRGVGFPRRPEIGQKRSRVEGPPQQDQNLSPGSSLNVVINNYPPRQYIE